MRLLYSLMCITPPLMEFLCLILLCVEHRLGVFGLWYLTVTRPDIACSVHIPLSLHQLLFTRQQFFRSWDISVVPSSRAFCFHPLRHWSLELTLIQIGLLMLLMQIDYRILYFSWRFFYSWKSRKPLYCRFHSWGRVRAMVVVKVVWLWGLLSDLEVHLTNPALVCSDIKSDIHIRHNSLFHECAKHIAMNCHFVHYQLTRISHNIFFSVKVPYYVAFALFLRLFNI